MFAPVLSPPREIESIYAYIRVFKAFGYPPKTDVAGRSSCPEVHDPRSRSHGHDHCRRPHRPRTSRLPPYPCGCFRTPRTKCTAFRRPFLLQAVLILVPPERLTCTSYTMLKFLDGLAVFVILSIGLLSEIHRWKRCGSTAFNRPNRPAIVPWWVPWLGNAIQYGRNPTQFVEFCRQVT